MLYSFPDVNVIVGERWNHLSKVSSIIILNDTRTSNIVCKILEIKFF